MNFMRRATCRRGAVLAVLIMSLAVAGVLAAGVARMFAARRQLQTKQEQHLQAALLAEAGIARAAAQLANDPNFTGETWAISADELGGERRAQVQLTIAAVDGSPAERRIVSQAALGDDAETVVKYTREATMEIAATADEE